MNLPKYIAVGVDAQPRGLAISRFVVATQRYIDVTWYPLEQGLTLEEQAGAAYVQASEAFQDNWPSYIMLCTIELPAAVQSSSTMQLWCICGAVMAAASNYASLTEGIVPTSWKKFSGLNAWAKELGIDKRGVVPKTSIAEGIISLVEDVPVELTPVDLYDAIAIGKAGLARNYDRVKALLR